MTLLYVNFDDPVGSLVQFNIICRLNNYMLIQYNNPIILSCIVRPFAGVHLEYLKMPKGCRVASTGFRKYRVK